MNRWKIASMAIFGLLLFGAVGGGTARAQAAKDLVGVWRIVSSQSIAPDGAKTDTFGPHAVGIAIFESNGTIAVTNVNPDVPKFASNSRLAGTPEENKAAVAGSVASFGDYTVADKVITIKFEGSTYPNWTGFVQKRTIAFYNGDEIRLTFGGSAGSQSEVVWKRMK
jgi:Lipocalin-like domain